MKHVAIDGLDVAVELAGHGRPLVLLHGILADSRMWQAQCVGLQDGFTVAAWDAPGCGRSTDPPETWRLPEYADCLAALIAALDLEAPVLAGLSWGAALAIQFQQRHPGVASALVLAGAYAGWAGSLPPEVCAERLSSCLAQSEMAPAEFLPNWLPGLLTPAAPDRVAAELVATMADFHPSGFRTMAHALAEADLRPALATIDVPVLLLYGDDDRRSPADPVGAELAARIPRARLAVIPNAGHVCNVEQPERFNAAVRDFATADH